MQLPFQQTDIVINIDVVGPQLRRGLMLGPRGTTLSPRIERETDIPTGPSPRLLLSET